LHEEEAVFCGADWAVLKQAELGVPVVEVIRKVWISEQTFYRWKKQYVGMETDQARQMKQLQEENSRLKQLVQICRIHGSDPL
jgi:putative transposase